MQKHYNQVTVTCSLSGHRNKGELSCFFCVKIQRLNLLQYGYNSYFDKRKLCVCILINDVSFLVSREFKMKVLLNILSDLMRNFMSHDSGNTLFVARRSFQFIKKNVSLSKRDQAPVLHGSRHEIRDRDEI